MVTWFKYAGELFSTLEEAQNKCLSVNPHLTDDETPDFFNAHIEEIKTEKWNGFGTGKNWADWHGEE